MPPPALSDASHSPAARLRGLTRRHVGLLLPLVIVAVGAIPYLAWATWPTSDRPQSPIRPDPRYASQSGSLTGARKAHIEQRSQEVIDAAVETCAGVGLAHLAAKYGLANNAEAVAHRFATAYEPAYQARVYDGCLHGLLEGG